MLLESRMSITVESVKNAYLGIHVTGVFHLRSAKYRFDLDMKSCKFIFLRSTGRFVRNVKYLVYVKQLIAYDFIELY